MKTIWMDGEQNSYFRDYAACFDVALPEKTEICAAADDNGEFGGFAALSASPDVVDILFFAVPEEKRRQGIGIFLLKEIEAAAASSGAGVLRAVLPGREDLLGFFEKADFALYAGGKEYAVSFGSLRYSSVYRKKVKGKEPFRAKALGGLNTSEREMLTAWCHDQDITDLSDYDEALSAACLSEGRLSALMLCEQMDKGVIVRHMYTDREQPEGLFDCFRVLNRALDLPYDKEEGSPDRADYMLSFGTGHTVEKTLLLHLAGDMVPITEITRETAAVKSLN